MPKRNVTPDEELANLSRREEELAARRDEVLVSCCMKKRPHCVALLVRTLRNHSYNLEDIAKEESNEDRAGAKSRQAIATEKRLRKLRESSHAAALQEMKSSPETMNWISTK